MVSLKAIDELVKRKGALSIDEINVLMEDFGSDYQLEKLDNGEIVMVNRNSPKQIQPNLFAHLKKNEQNNG